MIADYTIEVVLKKGDEVIDSRQVVEWSVPDNQQTFHTAFDALVTSAKLVSARYAVTDPGGGPK